MIYITGDTHCPIDCSKLNKKNFEDSNLTKEDYLIICGDAGFLWHNREKEDEYWMEWFHNKNYTTLFIDGNHENHDKLDRLPVEEWKGGKVHKLKDSVIHLMRGQVFTIDNLTFFTMGGANSIDRDYRVEGQSWWSREMPSDEEYIEALKNLDKHHWKVDYIISHMTSDTLLKKLYPDFSQNKLSNFLSVVESDATFTHWYCGHYHKDRKIDEKHTILYHKIVKLTEGL